MEAALSDDVKRRRLAVLVSGSGTNLQALLAAANTDRLPADIVGVISNRPDAQGLQRARDADVPAHVLPPDPGEDRSDYDARLAALVTSLQSDFVILAGWMRLLTMSFLSQFPERVVNLHPALPGELPGTHAIERAWRQAQAGERDHTGVMVHLVPDEGVDDGPVLATTTVPIHPSDTLEALEERVHRTEHQLLVDTVGSLCSRSPARQGGTP